jgi:hypothetical protein
MLSRAYEGQEGREGRDGHQPFQPFQPFLPFLPFPPFPPFLPFLPFPPFPPFLPFQPLLPSRSRMMHREAQNVLLGQLLSSELGNNRLVAHDVRAVAHRHDFGQL